MKATLIVEGKEFPIEIQDPELQKLLTPQKKTGYERVEEASRYYYVNTSGFVEEAFEDYDGFDDDAYNTANYYSSDKVAQNNARADKLMCQLRRFAVENGGIPSINDWKNNKEFRDSFWFITCDYPNEKLSLLEARYVKHFGVIYFNSKESAQKAIDTFYDELIWYFTEYKDSL